MWLSWSCWWWWWWWWWWSWWWWWLPYPPSPSQQWCPSWSRQSPSASGCSQCLGSPWKTPSDFRSFISTIPLSSPRQLPSCIMIIIIMLTWIFPTTPVESILDATLTAFPQMSYCGFLAPVQIVQTVAHRIFYSNDYCCRIQQLTYDASNYGATVDSNSNLRKLQALALAYSHIHAYVSSFQVPSKSYDMLEYILISASHECFCWRIHGTHYIYVFLRIESQEIILMREVSAMA